MSVRCLKGFHRQNVFRVLYARRAYPVRLTPATPFPERGLVSSADGVRDAREVVPYEQIPNFTMLQNDDLCSTVGVDAFGDPENNG